MTISTVGSAHTYTTWQAWENAADATLTAPWEAEAYIDNGTWFTTNGTTLTLAGITTSGTNFIEARPATGEGISTGIGAAGPLRADFTKGVGLQNTNAYGHAVLIQTDYTTLRGLQLVTTGNGGDAVVYNNNAFGTISMLNCLVEGQSASNTGQLVRWSAGDIKSCHIVGHSARSAGIGFQDWIGGSVINCTVAIAADDSDGTNAFHVNSGTGISITNTAFFGFTNDTNSDGSFTGSNNASDVAIGFGSSNQASVTYANQFEAVNWATRDFRAKAGGALISNATSTGAPSTDIVGQSFTNTIGAWQYQAAGNSIPPIMNSYRQRSL